MQKGTRWRVGNATNIHPNGKVNMLINEANNRWQEDLIRVEFNEVEAKAILEMPLAVAICEDEIVWHQTSWKIKTMPKVKLFAWRACNTTLPTTGNTASRIQNAQKQFNCKYKRITNCPIGMSTIHLFLFIASATTSFDLSTKQEASGHIIRDFDGSKYG
ncbi:hypothetical protein GOBAR_AA25209 [Gossypium barbadense]|uniref:Reverse transcriptase zinc-binding domain-containing protein n=1 Tax=Gossypium barbadense TaxID=3634 RepID=A0A2P5WWI4_GOSBA|nr:hypothetical protein GOBAR_AA25209 [Gossypium barbadense]